MRRPARTSNRQIGKRCGSSRLRRAAISAGGSSSGAWRFSSQISRMPPTRSSSSSSRVRSSHSDWTSTFPSRKSTRTCGGRTSGTPCGSRSSSSRRMCFSGARRATAARMAGRPTGTATALPVQKGRARTRAQGVGAAGSSAACRRLARPRRAGARRRKGCRRSRTSTRR